MSLFASLEIGKKSLSTAQAGQSTTGHNVSNVNTKGYSRQQVQQTAARPSASGTGLGVEMTGVRRIHDEFTKIKIVDEASQVGTWKTKADVLTRAEIIYADLEGHGLKGALNEFWGAWGTLANEPERQAHRTTLVSKGEQLANRFRTVDNQLSELRKDLSARMEIQMLEVNDMAQKIAKLNKQIQQVEAKGHNANDMRDERDTMVQEISERIEIKWFENKKGEFEIQVGNGHFLVHGREANPLITINAKGEIGHFGIGIRAGNGKEYDVGLHTKSGSLKELMDSRDILLKNYQEGINSMVKELAFNVNKLHASGTGIHSARNRETSAYGVNGEAREKPLPFLKDGEFEIQMIDEDEEISKVITVTVDAGVDTLDSIVEKINLAADAYETDPNTGERVMKKMPEFKATINEDGSVSLVSGLRKQFIYGKDETNIMPLLGFNNFFHVVNGAIDMRVNPELAEDEMKISAGKDLIPGDNSIAIEIASLQFQPVLNDGTVTLDEFYNSQIADVGLRLQRAQRGEKNHRQTLDQYEVLRDSVSSVNIDEEMANMVKYQRAYEASAKFMSSIDEMTQTVINM